MRFKFAVLLAGAFLFLTVPAFAGPISFCASGSYGPTDVGTSVMSGGLTATGWMGTSTTTQNTPTDLSCKDEGAAEFGLGIFADPTHDGEIGVGDFVQVAGLTGATITVIESVQSGEGFELFGSDTNGVLGTDLLGSGSGCGTCTATFNMGSNTYLDLTASKGNVLLDNVATPEPSTYLLMGTGLLMLGFLMRRKLASASV
ncbi:MAG TPA: PEP-CTERM sorting domain-containing protein [Candidatus Acidoferrales bacterium]|nr:PEP-CTERM sorting domain-containing protein [Candidatus Acidoferrales bacterium]